MSLTSLIIIAAIIIVLFLILRIIMKSIKMIAAVIILLAFLGVWLYGFSGLFDKVSGTKDLIPELGIENIARSVTGCTTDIECSYITNPGDCRMAKGYCNNVIKEENYAKMAGKETLEEPCNRTSIEIDYAIDCDCKLHKEREGKIRQWLGSKVEEKIGYTYCWKKETTDEPSSDKKSYTACGCGCCPDTEPIKECLYASKGDNIQDVIDKDKESAQNPNCALVGCSRPIEYSYCD